ncbi:hypothetical protein GCM10011344_42830 [Dokdonia pacifica]|uniref:Uncharacterized protein n=1 Tax=Dokdonia pacifica TaxID=1627892 RepID=A0A239AHL5_9FLAO|nr:hypothetical protein [Dokdonia pacifica]GGG37437.1 hypothetical protein GCM10011344_42830 [Dokdonia pacifica]SNR95040.1 hypothetical protein SAMN06265376_104441 [Dokdonia pacifica]
MLKSIFNDKAEHLKQLDFDYSIKGDIKEIGRMITGNFVRNKSSHYIQEKEKRYRYLLEFLHLQNVHSELDERLSRIDDLLDRIADNNDFIRDGFALLKTNDVDGMRSLLSGQNKSVHALNDDEIRNATQSLIVDTIDEQQELQNALEQVLIQFEDRIDGLNHNSEEYQNYKTELDSRRVELQKVSAQNNLNYSDAEKYLRVRNNDGFEVLKSENNKDKHEVYDSKSDSSDELSEQLAEDRANDPAQKETKLLFPEYKGMGLN